MATPLIILLGSSGRALWAIGEFATGRAGAIKSGLTGLATTLARSPSGRCMSVPEAIVRARARAIPRPAANALGLCYWGQRASPLPVAKVANLAVISHRLAGGSPFTEIRSTRAVRAGESGEGTFPLPAGVAQVAGLETTITAFLRRISNLDADAAALEGLTIQRQGLDKTLAISKLCIGKTLGPLLLAVLDDTDADNVASLEKFGNRLLSRFVREVSEMEGVRGLVGDLLRQVLANAGIASIIATTVAGSVSGASSLARRERLGARSISILNLVSP